MTKLNFEWRIACDISLFLPSLSLSLPSLSLSLSLSPLFLPCVVLYLLSALFLPGVAKQEFAKWTAWAARIACVAFLRSIPVYPPSRRAPISLSIFGLSS
ncbi:MAG: hypothetical protein Q7T55_16025, partial [Solirubrobacteraceae bacterium]|nr:hypothetical protein [Solirubrobacteraceae bacterium]